MDLRMKTHTVDDVTVMELGGDLELHNAPQLRAALQRLCEAQRPRLVVDLSGLSFIDSTGIGVIVGALKRARERGGTLDLVCPAARVRRIFEITGLMRALPLHADLETALRAAQSVRAAQVTAPAEKVTPEKVTPETKAPALTTPLNNGGQHG